MSTQQMPWSSANIEDESHVLQAGSGGHGNGNAGSGGQSGGNGGSSGGGTGHRGR